MKTNGHEPTMAERIVSVMGTKTLRAADIGEALHRKGWFSKSPAVQAHIATTLSSSTTRSGEGKGVAVHRFAKIERGLYRVATAEDITAEIRGLAKSSKSSDPKPAKKTNGKPVTQPQSKAAPRQPASRPRDKDFVGSVGEQFISIMLGALQDDRGQDLLRGEIEKHVRMVLPVLIREEMKHVLKSGLGG